MAKVHFSVKKRARQNEKRRQRNMTLRSALRTSIRKVITAVNTGDASAAQTALPQAVKALGKASSKGIIHRNQAARKISRLTRRVNALSAAH
ncbi:MAG TPA: 30S ribosomal protein S20 [Candidatus Entotheonella sp.]|jgi:small subunit ribosomal protein S20